MSRTYLTFPDDPYPDYETYAEGDRVVYVGFEEDLNSYEDMIGQTGTVTDAYEGDEELNPSVDVKWDNPVDDNFDSVNPWMLEREKAPDVGVGEIVLDEDEIAWVKRGIDEGQFEDFMVVHYASGAVEVCGYAQHNGPYQQFHHMEDGEREVDVFNERGDCTLHCFPDEESLREWRGEEQ